MKRTKLLFTVALVLILATTIILSSAKVFATEVDVVDEENTITEEGGNVTSEDENSQEEIEIHNGDLYILYGDSEETANLGEYVMDQYVDGNVYILGGNVKVTGSINGSLFVCAQNLEITEEAYIATHAFLFADTITFSGYGFDVYAASNNFNLSSSGYINRDLKLASSETANLKGTVGRDIDMMAQTINVYDDDENKLMCYGNLNYTSGTEIADLDKAQVQGETNFSKISENSENGNIVMQYVIDAVENIVFVVVIYAAFILLAPKFVEKSKEYISTRSILAFAVGIVFMILVPICALFLMLTTIGVGVAMALLLVYFTIIMVNSAVVTIAINEFASEKIKAINTLWKKILLVIPVSLIVFLVRQIPVIGGIVTAIILFVGTGITILYQFDKRKKEEPKTEEV